MGLVGLAVLLILASDSSTRAGISILFSSLFILILMLIIHHDLAADSFDLFQPLVWVGIMFFLPNFIIKSWYNVVVKPHVDYLRKIDQIYYLNLSLATGILSYICLVIGYYTLPCKKYFGQMFMRHKQSTYDAFVMKWPSFIMWLIGFVLCLYLLRTGGLGYTDVRESTPFLNEIQLLGKYNNYGMFVFFFCLVKIKSYRNASWYFLLAIMLSGECLFGGLMGSRGYLFFTGIILIAALQYSGYLREDIKNIILPVMLTFALLVVGTVFITQFRDIKSEKVGFDKPVTAKDAVDIYEEMGQRKQFDTWADTSEYFFDNVIRRANNMESLASVLGKADQSKEMEIACGIDNNMLKEFLWGLVPRFIYPEKPMMSDFAVKFGVIYHDTPPTQRSWSNPTVMGDLYRNIGYGGIVIGMLFLGMCLRVLYLLFIDDNKNPFLFVIYFFTIIQLNYEGTYVGLYHAFLRLLIMFVIFIILTGRIYKFILDQKIPNSTTIKTQRYENTTHNSCL